MNPVRSRRRWIFPFALPLALLAFWFITAPAVPASQCINAGGPPGTCSRFLSNLAVLAPLTPPSTLSASSGGG
jgi:hypothetical protein